MNFRLLVSSRTHVLLSVVGILASSSPYAAAPVHLWSQSFGDGSNQYMRSVTTDAVGNIIITGYFEGTVNFGGSNLTSAGLEDIFVAKFNSSGVHQWSQRFGNVFRDYGLSAATDADGNVILTGGVAGTVNFGGADLTSNSPYLDAFIAKFNSAGVHQWSMRFGDDQIDQFSLSGAVDAAGNVIITGSFAGTIDFGGAPLTSDGGFDIFVAKFNSAGTHQWSEGFGGPEDHRGNWVAVDTAGNVVVTGSFFETVNFGGADLTSAGDSDIFIAKFSDAGAHLWSHGFGDTGIDASNTVAVDVSGNVIISGSFEGTINFGGSNFTNAGPSDIFVAKFNAAGTHQWSHGFGDAGYQAAFSVATDGSADVIVTGDFEGTINMGGSNLTSTGSIDIFIARFNSAGVHTWSERFGDEESQVGYSVAADAFGNVILAGYFEGVVNFGGVDLTSAGRLDLFVAKFEDTLVPVLITSFEARPIGIAIEIRWDVWSDESLESVTLYRREDDARLPIVITDAAFNAATPFYIDASVVPGRTYHYEIVIRTSDGDVIRSPVATASVPTLVTMLFQNHPNPFNPETSMPFSLERDGRVTLRVYDVDGRLVATLLDENRKAGEHVARWNGHDAHGRASSSGIYFARLESNGATETRKLVLLK